MQDVGQQRRQIESAADGGRRSQFRFGRVNVSLIESDAGEQVTGRGRGHGPIVKHGQRLVDEAFRFRGPVPCRSQLGSDEIDPGPRRLVTHLVEGPGCGRQRRLRLAEALELDQRSPRPARAGRFQRLARPVELRQHRLVVLQGIGGQPRKLIVSACSVSRRHR